MGWGTPKIAWTALAQRCFANSVENRRAHIYQGGHRRRRAVANKFVDELEIFQVEEAVAQQYFFGYLTITQMAAESSEFLHLIHLYPWFWVTAHHAMFMAMFVALGRIFDHGTPHNIDALMSAVSAEIRELSVDALKVRLMKKGLSPEEVAHHTSIAHQLTPTEARELRRKIAHWRRVYEKGYKDIRNRIFAHRGLSSREEITALFAKTSPNQLKDLFKFLSSLRLALWAAYENGTAVNLDCYDAEMFVGERVRREGEKVLKLMVEGGRVAR